MTNSSATDAFLTGVLHRMMRRHGGSQIFLFGGEGDPFWAARTPVKQMELTLLRDALDFIEALEGNHPKPFVQHDPRERFTVASLDRSEDLYLVVFADAPDRALAEARVVAIRADLWPEVEGGRRPVGLLQT
jgi:hypothetical protein